MMGQRDVPYADGNNYPRPTTLTPQQQQVIKEYFCAPPHS